MENQNPDQYWAGKDRVYLDFFRLKEPPFSITPDPEFMFFSHTHESVIEKVLYGIKHRMGFILLTGEVGTGKTTICRSVLDQLDGIAHTVYIINPSLSGRELIATILDDLEIQYPEKASKKELILHLNRHLLDMTDRHPVVVIVDDAQTMPMETLEDLRLLSNLETDKEKLLQLVLVGQPEFLEHIGQMKMRQLSQRITINCRLIYLKQNEIAGYISRRLFVAGNNGNVRFTPGAIRLISSKSHGIPRLINKICDYALTAAYLKDAFVINTKHVRQALMELGDLGIFGTGLLLPSAKRKIRLRKNVVILFLSCAMLLPALILGIKSGPKLFSRQAPLTLEGMVTASLAPEGYSSSINTPEIKPYILLLGSFRSLDLTQRAVSHFHNKDMEVHWNRANPGSSSEWYRLYTGRFKTREEAQQYKDKNGFHDAIIVDAPWSVKIGSFDIFSENDVILKKLEQSRIDYDLRQTDQGDGEILSGAFTSRRGAEAMAKELAAFNFVTKVVRR